MVSKDEAVISPSLLKPEWSDLSKFEYNPDFDIGYMDWIEEAIGEEEWGWLDNTDISFIEDVAGLMDDEDVSEPEVKPKPKHLRCEHPLKDSSNTADKKARFGVPVSSPQQKKASQGVKPANTENSTKWAANNFQVSLFSILCWFICWLCRQYSTLFGVL